MARKPAGIKVGDRVLVEHEVTAVWDDGRITYEVPGTMVMQLATVPADHESIREVVKDEPAPRAKSGGVRVGGSELAKIFDEGR